MHTSSCHDVVGSHTEVEEVGLIRLVVVYKVSHDIAIGMKITICIFGVEHQHGKDVTLFKPSLGRVG